METLAYTSEKTNNSAVMFEQEGIMDVSRVDDTGNTPLFEARVKNDRQTSPRAYVHPERGVYGLEVPGEKFADESYKYNSHNAAQNRDKLKRTARNAQHSPLVTFAKDGVAYYAGIDSPYSIVVLTGEAGETAVATQLQGESEARTGVYLPNAGDRIYIVETALADHMAANPADENKIHSEILLADASSFAVFEVSDEFALNMAYNAKSAGKSNAEKLAKKRAAQAESDNRADTTSGAAATTEGTTHAASVGDSGQQASGDPENEGPYNVYDPEARVGSEMPILDTILIENEPTSAANAASQADPAPRVVPINEPLATSAPSASAQARERMRQSGDDNIAGPAGVTDSPESDASSIDKQAYFEERMLAAEALAAAVTAKRNGGKLFGRKRATESIEARNERLDKLERWTALFEKEQVKHWRAEGLSEDEVVERLVASQETRAARRAALNHDEFTKAPFAKLMDRYSKLPKKQKILLGIGAAGVIGLAGASVGAALGAAGAVGIAAAKVGKTYLQAKSKIYEENGTAPVVADREYEMSIRDTGTGERIQMKRAYTASELIGVSTRTERETRRQSFERSDKIKRKAAFVAAVGAVAVGAGAVIEHFDTVRNGVTNWGNDGSRPRVGVETSTGAGVVDEAPSGTPEVGGSLNVPTAEAPAATPPAPTPEYQFSSAARTVVAGEGFYNTFAEMGITNPAEQASLLQKVGPELVARGIAYPMADGTYGISRPGAFSQDVLELIQKSR